MMMTISFCLIGMSRKVCMLPHSPLYFSTDLATFRSLELILSPAVATAP